MSAREIAVVSRGAAGNALAEALVPLEHPVRRCGSAEEALRAPASPALIAVDITGEGQHGIDWIREARERGFRDELLALVDRGDPFNAVLALEVGADAILEIPSHPRVACAYVRRLLRARRPESLHLRVGSLEMHLGSRSARVNGRDLRLPESEYKLLACLARRAGEALAREELLAGAPPGGGRIIDSRICRLRGRLAEAGGPAVVTLRGRGYLLSDARAALEAAA